MSNLVVAFLGRIRRCLLDHTRSLRIVLKVAKMGGFLEKGNVTPLEEVSLMEGDRLA